MGLNKDMTQTARDISYALRQGQLVAIADETGWSIAADPINDKAVEQLMAIQQETGTDLSLVIQHAHQLVMYVAKLPDIAWELVDFSEKPLIVIFEKGKNISQKADPEAPIAIRKALNPEIQRLIGGFGRGLLTLSFGKTQLPKVAETAVSGHFGVLPNKVHLPRILKLGATGEIEFIRK